jgi:hypothetical protein
LFAKRIWYPLSGLKIRNVCHNLKTDVRDQTLKGQTGVRLIMNLEHSVQNVFAQTERCPHHNGIEKGGLLESKLTPTSLRPEVGHNYLFQKPVHRGKGTNSDLRVGLLLPLWSSAKEIQEIVHAGSLNTIWERNLWNMKHWNPDHSTDELWVNLNVVSSNNSLYN